ncbi:MAG: HAD family hydrolase [Rhodospirillales bacterium]
MTPEPLELVIFDCDGVLVDSEAAAQRVLDGGGGALGWRPTEAEADAFVGRRFHDLRAVFELGSGRALPANWPAMMQANLIAILPESVSLIPGADLALKGTAASGVPYRIASNSSHQEMAIKFAVTGLSRLVAGRVHSAQDVGIGKPAPDLFLAAAAAEGRFTPGPAWWWRISRPGVLAAIAAGMACVAYVPSGDGTEFAELGAWPLRARWRRCRRCSMSPRRGRRA